MVSIQCWFSKQNLPFLSLTMSRPRSTFRSLDITNVAITVGTKEYCQRSIITVFHWKRNTILTRMRKIRQCIRCGGPDNLQFIIIIIAVRSGTRGTGSHKRWGKVFNNDTFIIVVICFLLLFDRRGFIARRIA